MRDSLANCLSFGRSTLQICSQVALMYRSLMNFSAPCRAIFTAIRSLSRSNLFISTAKLFHIARPHSFHKFPCVSIKIITKAVMNLIWILKQHFLWFWLGQLAGTVLRENIPMEWVAEKVTPFEDINLNPPLSSNRILNSYFDLIPSWKSIPISPSSLLLNLHRDDKH